MSKRVDLVSLISCKDCPLEQAEDSICGHPAAPCEWEPGSLVKCDYKRVPQRCPLRDAPLTIQLTSFPA